MRTIMLGWHNLPSPIRFFVVAADVVLLVLLVWAACWGLPGYSGGTDHPGLFWLTFWATLVAGLVLAGPVGVVLAFLLAQQERDHEARHARERAQQAYGMLLEELRFILIQPPYPKVIGPLDEAQRYAREVDQVVQRFDVPTLRAQLHDQAAVFDAVHDLRRAWHLFKVVAELIEQLYRDGVRAFESTGQTPQTDTLSALTVQALVMFAVLTATGTADDTACRQVGYPEGALPSLVRCRQAVADYVAEHDASWIAPEYAERLALVLTQTRQLVTAILAATPGVDALMADDLRTVAAALKSDLTMSHRSASKLGESKAQAI